MAKLLPETVDALLDKLSSDDNFRDSFQANPREATRSLGTSDPAVDSLPTSGAQPLASKEAFSASRPHVRKQLLDASGPFDPVTLDMPKP